MGCLPCCSGSRSWAWPPLAGTAGAQGGPDGLASLARAALPAVVTITVPDESGPGLLDEDGAPAELRRELFGELLKGRRQAVATGVILDADGLVITSAHAVAGAGDIEATMADGVSRKATVVGLDRKTDVAVLRLRGPGPFAHARLGDSDAVRVGDWVLAIGSPYGLGATVTRGIISAMPRARPRAVVDDLLQTDAATFLDSVGGPLVNARGEVIGFTTVLTLHDFGISFALPGNAARKIVAQLVAGGRGGAWIARRAVPGTDPRARQRRSGRADAGGLLIADINPQGAAARAGVRQGDVVTKLDGRPVEVPYDVEHVLRNFLPAQTIELTYWRRGRYARVAREPREGGRVRLARGRCRAARRPCCGSTCAR